MTFSILALDRNTGTLGGAAATGSLCVGGWVLRGSLDAGMSASQGAAPSTFWGEGVLALMRDGTDAASAVSGITAADSGRDYRQLGAVDLSGRTGAFTGASNQPAMGCRAFDAGIACGNLLADTGVLDAMADAFGETAGTMDNRLLAALRAAASHGGDRRGLLSAALLVLHPDRPPLTLRIDHDTEDPIGALERLHLSATTGDYGRWTRRVPVQNDRERCLG